MHQAQQNKKVSKQIQKSINKKNEEKMPFTKQLSREKINQIIVIQIAFPLAKQLDSFSPTGTAPHNNWSLPQNIKEELRRNRD